MTRFDKPVRRVTLNAYSITISGVAVSRSPSDKPLVVRLHGDQMGDYITIRPSGARDGGPASVTLDVAGEYRRGMLATIAQKRKARKQKGVKA